MKISTAILHVPAGTKARYQAADVWKEFGTIVEYADNSTCNELIKLEAETTKAYASNGILNINGLQPGMTFSVYGISVQGVLHINV